jgi:hypothetical protein
VIAALALAATCSATPRGASAQAAQEGDTAPNSEAPEAAARRLYAEGLELFKLRRFHDAIEKFTAAYQLTQAPGFLYNLAQAHRLKGNCVEALEAYRKFLTTNPAGKVRELAEARVRELEPCSEPKPNETPQATAAPAGTSPLRHAVPASSKISTRPARTGRLIWMLVGGVGVSGMLGSWFALARHSKLDSELDELHPDSSPYESKLHERDTWSNVAIVSTSVGSGLFAGAGLFLPDAEPPAWLSWTTGAVGVAAVTAGTALWLRNGRLERIGCSDEEQCLRTRSTVPLAPILVTQGASLLAFPVRSLLRTGTGAEVRNVALSLSPGELGIHWSQDLPSL